MKWMRRLESWWWSKSHPEWEEPDATTPAVIRDWIASHRHPAECAWGCRCKHGRGEEVT